MPRAALGALVAVAGVMAAAAPAGATTVRSFPDRTEIVGGPGEVNGMKLRHDMARPAVRIDDSRPIATVSMGGPPCTRLGPSAVDCPYPTAGSRSRFVIDLGDRDDRLLIDAERTSSEIYVGVGLFSEVRDGPGDDRATSIPTTTTFVTGPGNDVLRGAARATPGGGDDLILGTVGPDALDGGAGRDTIRGGDGADTLRGGAGHDRLFGEGGQDRLFGGRGNDLLRGGPARDRLFGGSGRNTLIQG